MRKRGKKRRGRETRARNGSEEKRERGRTFRINRERDKPKK